VGIWPGLADSTVHAAGRFIDRPGYAATVLHAAPTVTSHTPPPGTPHWYDWLYGALSVTAAALMAAGLLLRRELPARVLRPLSGLRALHSGHPGDYAAWTAAGAAALAGLLVLTMG
jgi:multicomponent Na+:H+ antiporter subunit D